MDTNVFHVLPGCFLLLDPGEGFCIRDATDAYLNITQKNREIIGQPLFEVFPDNPEDNEANGVKNLTASLKKVIQTRKADHMAIQRYDTREAASGRYLMRYWKPVNIPVMDSKGEVVEIIHAVEDVTNETLLKHRLKFNDTTRQQQINNAVTTTQEMERMEISRELHDNVNQILTGARLYLGRMMHKPEENLALLQPAHDLLVRAISEIRKLSNALLTTSQQEEKLVHSLEEILEQVISYGSIQVKKEIELPEESLIETKIKVAILRIVQEQVANVIKHAEARNLYIGIHFKDNKL